MTRLDVTKMIINDILVLKRADPCECAVPPITRIDLSPERCGVLASWPVTHGRTIRVSTTCEHRRVDRVTGKEKVIDDCTF